MKIQDDKRTAADVAAEEDAPLPTSPTPRGTLRVRSTGQTTAPVNDSGTEVTDAPTESYSDYTEADVAAESANGYANNNGQTALEDADATQHSAFSTQHSGNGHFETDVAEDTDVAEAPAPEKRRIRIGFSRERVKEQAKAEYVEPVAQIAVARPPRTSGSWLTWESGLYLLFFFTAIMTRFWDLGVRALHHDESLHATYSWYFYTGTGYTHDPMMHGPFQFHTWGLFYFLFGDSDFSVRMPSAVLSIIVVISPFFLRNWVGRGAALIMSFLFLISPGFLYFGQFAREDAYVMGIESLLVIGLIGFIATRKAGYFYMFMVLLSILFAIKETAYITTFIYFTLFIPLFFWQLGKRYFGLLALYGVAAAGLWSWMSKLTVMKEVPGSPGVQQPYDAFPLPQMPGGDNPQLDVIFNYFGQFLSNPRILAQLGLFVLFLVVFGLLLYRQRRALINDDEFNRSFLSGAGIMAGAAIVGGLIFWVAGPIFQPLWFQPAFGAVGAILGLIVGYVVAENMLGGLPRRSMLLAYPAGSLPQVVGTLLARPHVLFIGIGGFLAVFFVFYTSLFENIPKGIGSGAVGALGYWISQQPVARGGQPWFYYLLLVPLYEPISFFFSFAGIAYFASKGFRWALNEWRSRYVGRPAARPAAAMGFVAFAAPAPRPAGELIPRKVAFGSLHAFLILFFTWWVLLANGMYGWAGEKMPWLEVHVDQPAVYLSAMFLAAIIGGIFKWQQSRRAVAAEAEAEAERVTIEPEPVVATPIVTRGKVKATAQAAPAVRAARKPASVQLVQQRQAQQSDLLAPIRAWTQPGSWLPTLAFVILYVILAFAYMFNMATRSYDLQWNKKPVGPDAVMWYPIIGLLILAAVIPWRRFQPMIRAAISGALVLIGGIYIVISYASAAKLDPANKPLLDWGVVAWYPIAMLFIFAVYAGWQGIKPAFRALLVSLFLIMALYQIRTAINLAYYNGDVAPKEMAVYVQTGHDLVDAVRRVEKYQMYKDNQLDMPVIYDSDFSWPGQWYLRNFSQKKFMPSGPLNANDTKDVMFMFLGSSYHDPGADPASGVPSVANQFTTQQYVLRWWFDEQIYRNFVPTNALMPDGTTKNLVKDGTISQNVSAALGSIMTLGDPATQARLWRYLIYREPYPTGGFSGNSVDFKLYVRKDIYQEFNELTNK